MTILYTKIIFIVDFFGHFGPLCIGLHYISDDPIFCYAAIDGLKKSLKTPTSVIFHTKVQWGIKYLERSLPEVQEILIRVTRFGCFCSQMAILGAFLVV